MATLGLHRDFLLEFAALEKPVQRRVAEMFDKFRQHRHAGLHLEKLAGARDDRIRTVRVDRFWRGVVLAPAAGDAYLLLKVLPHDDAIDWAVRRRATYNSATQGIELRDDDTLERATAGFRALAEAAPERRRLFGDVSDADLTRLGVDADVLPVVRSFTDEAQLDGLRKYLPEQQYDVLAGLAAGLSPEEVWREVVQAQLAAEPSPADVPAAAAENLAAAMARSRGRIALVSGPDELQDILARPFDAWRVFLHPSQHRVAYRPSYSGPARVSGGPGTGKTVVALHRAAYLAGRLPAGAPDGSILLTTYTRDLATDLQRSLEILVPDPALRAKVHITNVDALANHSLRQHLGGGPIKIVPDRRDLLVRWGRIARRLELDVTDSFLDQEWRHVVLAQDLGSAEDYLQAARTGRGTALGPLKRAHIWRAVSAFTEELRAAGERTFLQVCAEAARALDAADGSGTGEGRPYRHVIVDEAQDFHPAQWRFLRALVAPGPDDLFIAGDPHQRIYGNKVSLRSLGIGVTGRSTRLRINYRTTGEILTWAVGLLSGEIVDDMDGGAETFSGYRSDVHGDPPRLVRTASKAAELAAVTDQIATWLAQGVAPAEIGVAVRFLQLGRDLARALEHADIPATVLGAPAPRTGGVRGHSEEQNGVRIATMHRMKGLEFRCMAVAGANEGVLPMRSALAPADIDPQQHKEDVLSELSLLFVACTRAREALLVSCHGTPSPFLRHVAEGNAESGTSGDSTVQ
ncbi:ATP-dependent helicase [Streptomyces aculeolatus]|uniref:UvrD-helicase domain-containing protein n=1 Tax=Streptomyces aculeolatus TaxID=270689 RepID=UPI001CECE1EE|nr:UvrD-helicase domain-containing protein [Streptomyces aculeolatus]